ncbi:hypothetical protein AAFF_G00428100 [Aldrovandia affinis]|uniref:Uncharacterized protein n=1 Tax=Aldrovandia affinis TaxID=143900 RepID=A0AAD7S947_9TELE|nr:hypothetical protein AAFF_G00428100 [Aldrovandia affinis]
MCVGLNSAHPLRVRADESRWRGNNRLLESHRWDEMKGLGFVPRCDRKKPRRSEGPRPSSSAAKVYHLIIRLIVRLVPSAPCHRGDIAATLVRPSPTTPFPPAHTAPRPPRSLINPR